MVFIFIIVLFIFVSVGPLVYNYLAECGRIRNYLTQQHCQVLAIKLIGMQSRGRMNNLYEVRYADFAYNLFRVECEAANLGYGLSWFNKRFIRRLSDSEIADLGGQSELQSSSRFAAIGQNVFGKVEQFRESGQAQVSFDSVSDDISILNQNVPSYSLKERLIDGLQSHVANRRMNTITYIQTLDSVDEVVVQVLREVALCDPKPWVREHARLVLDELRGEKEKSLKN